MLEIRGLEKKFGKYQVLNGLDMTVPEGSLYGFVGPNGKPIPLTEEEVEKLGVDVRTVEVNYEVGNSVKIIHGPLEGFIGRVEEVDTDKDIVKVTVSMFGRDTLAELQLGQVELVKD